MKNSKKIVYSILYAISAILIIGAVVGYITRGTSGSAKKLDDMRFESVVHAGSEGVVSSVASAASAQKLAELRKKPDFRSMGSDEVKALCAEAEEAARVEAEASYSDVLVTDDQESRLRAAIGVMESSMADYAVLEREEKEVFEQICTELHENVDDWAATAYELDDAAIAANLAAVVPELADSNRQHLVAGLVEWAKTLGEKAHDAQEAEAQGTEEASTETAATEDVAAATEEVFEVDYTYFAESEELTALKAPGEEAFANVWGILCEIIPELSKLKGNTLEKIQKNIETIVNSASLGFSERYEIYEAEKATENGGFILKLAAKAQLILIAAIALLILTLVLTFWEKIVKKLGVPRTIIGLFFIYLCMAAILYNISVPLMLGNVLERAGMYGILALAMLPGIQCGIGLNMGMTLGCIAGLLSTVISLQYDMTGAPALLFSAVGGILIAIPLGWAYSLLLNRMKGDEMTISTYVGFSFVSLMCIGWMLLPFTNTKIIWLLCGRGLRVTHSLLGSFGHLLDDFLAFKIFGITVPTGLLLVFFAACAFMWVFSRSKAGIAMSAVGSNPRFAEASGLNVDKYRTLGTVMSTCIAALGIVIYSQAFGYAQLYTAPRQLGFIAASAILIGGATTKKAKVGHVIIGVLLFEGVLALGQQIANAAVAGGGLSEVMRIMISNGIILYALTQSGGANNE